MKKPVPGSLGSSTGARLLFVSAMALPFKEVIPDVLLGHKPAPRSNEVREWTASPLFSVFFLRGEVRKGWLCPTFGPFCFDVRTGTFCQRMGFPY